MVNMDMFYQCMQEHADCYSNLKDMLAPASQGDKNIMVSASKQHCNELKLQVLSAEGEIFGKSKKAELFREYMLYHMLICIVEGRKDYIEALPIEFRGMIIHFDREHPLWLYQFIIKAVSLSDVYFAMDVLCPLGDDSAYRSLLRVQYNMEIFYAKYFDAEWFEESAKKLDSGELELREMNMKMGDMSAKLGAESLSDRQESLSKIAAAIKYYEERKLVVEAA